MNNEFSDRKGRSTFATKVLATVLIQFGILAAMCNTMLYSSEDIVAWFKGTSWWVLLIFGLSVPAILIAFLVKPNLMTQKPKNIFSLVFLTLLIGAFTAVLAVYVAARYTDPNCKQGSQCVAAEQIISSGLYGVMVSVLVCLVLNWIMDMETQFKIMIAIQLLLSIASGFMFWWIFGWEIVYIAAILSFIIGIMTWMMFFLRMIFFADFLQESADDMGVEGPRLEPLTIAYYFRI